MQKRDKKWDVFISHAVEDQESFVRKLAVTLIERTFAWLNQFRRLRLRMRKEQLCTRRFYRSRAL